MILVRSCGDRPKCPRRQSGQRSSSKRPSACLERLSWGASSDPRPGSGLAARALGALTRVRTRIMIARSGRAANPDKVERGPGDLVLASLRLGGSTSPAPPAGRRAPRDRLGVLGDSAVQALLRPRGVDAPRGLLPIGR